MAYKHILVAVDLSAESEILIQKAVSMARPYDAQVSIIHVGINYSDLYSGLIDLDMANVKDRVTEDTHTALKELTKKADYPIVHTLSGNGEFTQVLSDAIEHYKVDLVICGHHHDFWSKLMSSARQLINKLHVDILIVPLLDD